MTDLGYHSQALPIGVLVDDISEVAEAEVAVLISTPEALTWAGAPGQEPLHRRLVLGGEMLGYAAARQTGDDQLTISGVVRGLRGTQQMVASHAAGTPALFLPDDDDWGIAVSAPVGSTLTVIATGPGDGLEGVTASIVVAGL